MKETRNFMHRSIECFSYLKKHDMENYVKEEAAIQRAMKSKPRSTRRVSLSNPRSTRSSLPKEPSSKHQVEAISLVSSILSISILGSDFYHDDKKCQD